MKHLIFLPLLLVTLLGCQLSESERDICRKRASNERNEFSAKQTFNACKKTIKKELRLQKQKQVIRGKWEKCFEPYQERLKELEKKSLDKCHSNMRGSSCETLQLMEKYLASSEIEKEGREFCRNILK